MNELRALYIACQSDIVRNGKDLLYYFGYVPVFQGKLSVVVSAFTMSQVSSLKEFITFLKVNRVEKSTKRRSN